MGTKFLFRDQSYLRQCQATVTAVHEDGSFELDQTIFYAQSGGQPGDSGQVMTDEGQTVPIINTLHPGDKTAIIHVPGPGDWHLLAGDRLECQIDWQRRFNLMRMHTALHLLSIVFPFPVTGGAIGVDKSRLDFDMPEVPENLTQLGAELNTLIAQDHQVSDEWISEAELEANPELIKTMKVKPPMGQGRVRLIRIASGQKLIDLQPCGGTHVASTGEIGAVRIGKIQKKGRQNRRVYLHLV